MIKMASGTLGFISGVWSFSKMAVSSTSLTTCQKPPKCGGNTRCSGSSTSTRTSRWWSSTTSWAASATTARFQRVDFCHPVLFDFCQQECQVHFRPLKLFPFDPVLQQQCLIFVSMACLQHVWCLSAWSREDQLSSKVKFSEKISFFSALECWIFWSWVLNT